MHNYIVDANCLLSYVTDRAPAQYKKIEPYFVQAADFKCTVSIIETTIAEFVYVLEKIYKHPPAEIAAMLRAFIATPGLTVLEQSDFSALLHLWPDKVKDFGDAAIAAAGVSDRFTVLTFDRSFGKELGKLHIPHILL